MLAGYLPLEGVLVPRQFLRVSIHRVDSTRVQYT